MAEAIDTKTGSNIAVVAKFEVISVKKLTDVIKIKRIKINGMALKDVICWPIQTAKPLVSKPSAKAIPPPNKRIIPQGNFIASSQSNNLILFLLLGNKKSRHPANMLIIVSSTAGINLFIKKDLLIQAKAVKTNTDNTIFSSKEIFPSLCIRFIISLRPP